MDKETKTEGEISKEFPQGKESYCPRCYFDDDTVILRKDCPHNPMQEPIKDIHGFTAEDISDMAKGANEEQRKLMQEPAKENWEEDLAIIHRNYESCVKFISQLLAKQKEAITNEINKLSKEPTNSPEHCSDCHADWFYNLALEDVKDFILEVPEAELLARQKAEIINRVEEKLKHIAMYHERGDGKSVMPTYAVKDVLDILETLKAD